MKVKLVHYHWKIDTSMDPYARSGDEDEYQLAVFIPGDGCPDVLVLAADIPIFYEMSTDNPGKNLSLRFGIQCREREFIELDELEIDNELVLNARAMARLRDRSARTNTSFKSIFENTTKDE